MSSEEHVFSHVGCLSLSGFDEISEVVFEAGTSLTEKTEQEKKKKRLQNVYIFVGSTAGSQNVRERECVCAVSVNEMCAVSVSRNEESESLLSVEVKM